MKFEISALNHRAKGRRSSISVGGTALSDTQENQATEGVPGTDRHNGKLLRCSSVFPNDLQRLFEV